MNLCKHCKAEPEEELYVGRDTDPDVVFCSTCRSAFNIVHTSVDDARNSLFHASKATVLRALEMVEPDRKSMCRLLQSRLRKIESAEDV
jgi:hypothetical protein